MSGLIIQNKRIKKLSGPVSMFMLEPTNDFFIFMKNNGGLAPNIMLFGDEHIGNEDDLCETDTDAYAIYDYEFISLLNSYPKQDPNISVQFYLEFFDKTLFENEEEINKRINKFESLISNNSRKLEPPLYELRNKYLPCFYNKLRQTKNFNCEFSDIKWNMVDVRSAYGNLEGYLFSVLFGRPDYNYVFPNNPNLSSSYTYAKLDFLDFIIDTFNLNYENYSDVKSYIHRIIEAFILFKPNNMNNKIVAICITLVSKLILSIFDTKHYVDFIQTFFNEIETNLKDYSIIYKQIKEQIKPFQNISMWKDLFIKYGNYKLFEASLFSGKGRRNYIIAYLLKDACFFISNILNIIAENILNLDEYELESNLILHSITESVLNNINNLKPFMVRIKSNLNPFNFIPLNHDILKLFGGVDIILGGTSTLLDIYFILRILKPKQYSGKYSALSVGYFGYLHTENITRFFTTTFKKYYNLTYKKDVSSKKISKIISKILSGDTPVGMNNLYSKCLNLSDCNINLNSLLIKNLPDIELYRYTSSKENNNYILLFIFLIIFILVIVYLIKNKRK